MSYAQHPVDMRALFAPGGALAEAIPGFERRKGQVQLADAMAEALTRGLPLLAEAGTGIGKSLAYLVTLAATEQRAVIATHTKALQDQLWRKDIPLLRTVWPEVTAAVLKGRANYLCRLEFEKLDMRHAQGELDLETRAAAAAYRDLRDWALSAEAEQAGGDLDQVPFALPEELRAQVTVDGQGCVGRKCPFYAACYSQRAKAAAASAQLVVVNHRLLLLDLILNEQTEGAVSLLPEVPVIVLDEAHHLEDVATDSLGVELSSGRWRWVERRVDRLADEVRPRVANRPALLSAVARAQDQAREVTEAVGAWFDQVLEETGHVKVREFQSLLTADVRQEGTALADDTAALGRHLFAVADFLGAARSEAEQLEGERWEKMAETVLRLRKWLSLALVPSEADEAPMVRAVERVEGRRTAWAVVSVRPIRVDDALRRLLWEPRQVLAVSATLATGHGEDAFDYWRDRVGVPGPAVQAVIPSPFPFARTTRLYVPQPGAAFDPSAPAHKEPEGAEAHRARVVAAMQELLRVRTGGAFVLFTSYGMLRYAAERLDVGTATLLCQGAMPAAELVQRFRDDGEAVLLGTRTFWEGVDVPGEALSLVIIDRLPFAVPDDPLWEARRRDVGDDWFRELALPQTLMALKQAFGRLIRRMDDRGVVAILDGRLRTKSYGRGLIAGLPPARLVGSVAEVAACFGGERT